VEGLPCNEALRDRAGFKVFGVRNRDIDADGNQSLGRNPCLVVDDRLGIAVVADPLERDIA
jgi:hypothetical protein